MWPFKKKVEEVKKAIPPQAIIFNVNNFNIWFCAEDNGATYAHKGIFLRADKLGQDQINDYLLNCYGISNYAFLGDRPTREIFSDFEKAIREDWMKQINHLFNAEENLY
jgi:hypothetical protein